MPDNYSDGSRQKQSAALDDFRAALADRAADLAVALLGEPKRKTFSELRYGNHGGFTVWIAGAKRGGWVDSAAREGGDLLSLIMRQRRCSFRGAIDFARDFVGRPSPRNPVSVPDTARASREKKPPPDAWKRIWHDSVDPRGTLVETYLRSRHLELPDEIAGSTIRFHSSLWYDGVRQPGMVALFRDIHSNEGCGIHRTYFDKDGCKIDRRMLGRAGGAAIKLDPDENVTEGLHIGEGIETCLAAMLAGYRPTWAVGSAGGIAAFPLLAGVDAISVLTEKNDGNANQDAVEQLRTTWAEREVLVIEPLIGNDCNDAWRADHA
jgi:hypothetical protein